MYGTRWEHADHYTTNSVHMKISRIFIYLPVIVRDYNGQKKKVESTNNGLQNTTQKAKD
jgi:hypothetical protein